MPKREIEITPVPEEPIGIPYRERPWIEIPEEDDEPDEKRKEIEEPLPERIRVPA